MEQTRSATEPHIQYNQIGKIERACRLPIADHSLRFPPEYVKVAQFQLVDCQYSCLCNWEEIARVHSQSKCNHAST